MIEAEETGRAVEQLRTTLKVCSTFKSTYFDYKAKSSVECPNDAWRIQNTGKRRVCVCGSGNKK